MVPAREYRLICFVLKVMTWCGRLEKNLIETSREKERMGLMCFLLSLMGWVCFGSLVVVNGLCFRNHCS